MTVTYLGRRAEVTETNHDSKSHGLRTVVTRWIDDADERNGGYPAGTIVTRIVEGDGRTDDFIVHSETVA